MQLAFANPNQKCHDVGFCVRQFSVERFGDRVVPESFNDKFWKKVNFKKILAVLAR
jgi:hypothetical protein